MPVNRKYLIRQLSSIELDGRYTNIKPVNCDAATGKKHGPEGALSVVFKADDAVTGKPVAIKFFDPEFGGIQQLYRLAAFKRESELLESIVGKYRCLQLLSAVQEIKIPVTTDAGDKLELSCAYCVIEWIDEEIKQYFTMQDRYEALAKLYVYRDAVLAVFALHHNDIHHRDVKADNLMRASRQKQRPIVAIDLGTAAKVSSAALGDPSIYAGPVGAPHYAPLEALCGLSGVRSIGHSADFYALGCLLYELFNLDYYFVRLRLNIGFIKCKAVCEGHMMPFLAASATETKLIEEWSKIILPAKRLVTLPNIEDPGSSVVLSVRQLLNDLLHRLTALDHRERINNRDMVVRKIDSAITTIQNHLAEVRRAAERKARREARRKAAQRKQQRLMKYLQTRDSDDNG